MQYSEGSGKFLLPLYGVSTKWLGHCLACFLWTKQTKYSKQDSKEMLSGQLAEGSYVHTRHALVDMPQSLWDCWKTRAEANGGLTENFAQVHSIQV
ncbi:MAG: hypothetical protein DUD39_17350 [Coriobacteriaceae bacterium]|jgi:hypothetical protein|nr:MAG: hypothetical protein DUD39_17350 [Coriobacteriaceae bacterium]